MQSDVSVYRNLLFVSGESLNGRIDCGTQGIQDTVSADRLRGIRIYDISDLAHPRSVANVQTCRGSHTHTVVTDAHDTGAVYVYVSGQAPVRSPNELAGCASASPDQDTSSALFRLDVIRVPLATPEQARIVNRPRIFEGLSQVSAHGPSPVDSAQAVAVVDSVRAAKGYAVIMERRGRHRPAALRDRRCSTASCARAAGAGRRRPPTAPRCAARSRESPTP